MSKWRRDVVNESAWEFISGECTTDKDGMQTKSNKTSTHLVLWLGRSPRIVIWDHEAVEAPLAGVSLSNWTNPSTSSSPDQIPSSSFTNAFSFTPTLFNEQTAHCADSWMMQVVTRHNTFPMRPEALTKKIVLMWRARSMPATKCPPYFISCVRTILLIKEILTKFDVNGHPMTVLLLQIAWRV